jgi:ribA/ribD-fused uncharacterized protein
MNQPQEPIYMWEDEFYPLSHFAAFSVEYENVLWQTAEHAYQAASFTDTDIRNQITLARSAHDARMIGQKLKKQRRPDWGTHKLVVMEELLRAKLAQHPYVREKLLASGNREIIKNVPDDSYWGWGIDHKGENRMGKLWMKLREELQSNI